MKIDKRTRALAETLGVSPAVLAQELTDSARATLKRVFPRGARVTFSVKHVSPSGSSRAISVLGVDADGEIVNVSAAVARVIGWRFSDTHMAVTVSGGGMDMTYHVLFNLSRELYSDDRALVHGGRI